MNDLNRVDVKIALLSSTEKRTEKHLTNIFSQIILLNYDYSVNP